MNEKKLACCVVRDLLPSYMEGLTETETTALVKEHIDHCPDCQKREQDMCHAIPVEKTPKRELSFLKRFKRIRIFAAVLSCIVALFCIWWLYDREFHYPNTEAGRLAALEDYLPLSDASAISRGSKAETSLHAGAWEEKGRHLFVFYFVDNQDNAHGLLHLVRGINGKYRIIEAQETSSGYTGGIYGKSINPKGTDWELFYLAEYNCREIYRAEVEFRGGAYDGVHSYTAVKDFELSGENDLQLIEQETLKQELGLDEEDLIMLTIKEVKLFDKEGNDVTGDYFQAPISDRGGKGKTTAESFLLYVYIGIVALLGIVFVRYFLRRDA